MKFQKQFSFAVKNDQPNIVIAGCDVMDIVANITYLVHYIHGRFKEQDPKLAEGFRDILLQVIADPESPCWEDVKRNPNATEIFFTTPK